MTSNRPAAAVIQRANSLQASDTSHTSASTGTSHTTNTSASTTPSKASPVSSIGESLSDAKALSIPPARPVRPLPIPPSHLLTSTSTLRLSHQESQSTIGKSKAASAPMLQPPPRKARSPPSSFPRISDDNQWVSISLLPVEERTDNNERLPEPVPRPKHKRSASADPTPASKPKFPKHSTRTTAVPSRTDSKSLPRLPDSTLQPLRPRQADASWKLEFRGVVKLVRWVSRRDKRANVENEDIDGVLDEKEPVPERRSYSIASLGRKSRDGKAQPRTGLGAPNGVSLPRPSTEMDEAKEVGKRRLTKSNPGLFGRNSSELNKRPSTEFGKRSSRRATSDAAQKVMDITTRTSVELTQQTTRERARRPSADFGMAPNAGGVFIPDVPLAVSTPTLSVYGPQPQPGAGLSDPIPSAQLRIPTSSTLLTQTTTVTQTYTTSTTTTTTVSAPIGFTSSLFPGSSLPNSSVLTPVLEGPIYQSPPAIDTASEFPWVGVAVSGGLSPVGSNAVSSAASMGGVSMSPVVSRMSPVEAVMHEAVSPVVVASPLPQSSSMSPLSGSPSPMSVSPLMSVSTSPLMSSSTSPFVSHTASPLLFSNTLLAETAYAPINVPSVDTPATSSSLSYATARSNRNSMTAQVESVRYAATDLGHGADPRFEVQYTQFARFSAAATDIGHGTSTRATSPTPSDRYALSEDVHGPGILRALSTADHSDAPLPMPRRPFMAARDSSGSVTFDDSSAQSSPKMGGRRKMMTMSASDVGHGVRAYAPPSRHQVQRSSSSLSIAGRIMRTLSIGSKGGQDSETEGARTTRKLTRRKIASSRASSTLSLALSPINTGIPPVPPLPAGILTSSRYASEHGHESNLGHGGSVLGHGQNQSEWGASTSVLGHGSNADPTSPAPTRLSFATTQSAPSGLGGGRNKLVKRRRDSNSRPGTSTSGQTLASLNLGEVSRDPPRITTEFVQLQLSDDMPLTLSAGGTTEDGHLMPPRPGLPRRTSSQRRWTIADMDDEEFLRQLEARLSGVGGLLRQSRMLDDFAMGANQNSAELENYRESETDDSVAEREWVRVRRAMMCVREIVRTEKSYMKHLVGFRDSEDASNMSSILAEHLPRLIETSRMFCALLEDDPSAWGVSRAFLAAEEQLEATLVCWSSVVGEVISSPHHRTESQATSEDGHTSSAGSASSSWIRRRSATAGSGGQASFPLSLAMTPVNAVAGKSKKSTRGTKGRRITEQDIVIAPTQRAIRYVLMYRELLLHTSPTSASHHHVEQALQRATRIARMCDEAQNHADHILSP